MRPASYCAAVRGSGIALIVTLFTAVFVPGVAQANERDAGATHRYLVAAYALATSAQSHTKAAERKIRQLNVTLGRRCGDVAINSPQNDQSQRLSNEVAGALWSIVYHVDIAAVKRFVRTVGPLRWSDRTITRVVRAYATSLRQLSALPMPDLCGDVRSWVASGFTVVPASTIAFDHHLDKIEASAVSLKKLARYERPEDRGLAGRLVHVERQLERIETSVGFEDWNMLLETLKLNQ